MHFAQRTHIPSSETLRINALAQEKKKRGEQIYNLSVGEPDIETDPVIIDAVTRAMKEGKTTYPPVLGIPELRHAASWWMNQSYGGDYQVDHTMVTTGGKFGLYALFQVLLEPGDEVLIVSPYWVSYPSMIHMAGGNTVVLETSELQSWKVTAEQVERACTDRTKVLVMNNASNPTGVMYSREELRRIADIAVKKKIIIISDEVYSGLVYDSQEFVSFGSFTEYKKHIIIVQSASKNFAMTGLRVGFIFAESDIIAAVGKVQGQSTSGAASICQWAALAGLQHTTKIMPSIRATMERRRDIFTETWNKEFDTSLAKPQSALYSFIAMNSFGIHDQSSMEFCMQALEHANVAMVPGTPFGAEGYVRCSFGAKEEAIISAIQQLKRYAKK